MRQPASQPRPLEHAGRSRNRGAVLCAVGAVWLLACSSGCGLMGSGQQLKQLQMENDRLLSEYRAQRERVSKLQETNAALEARVGEAERLLAQAGKTLPSSRISRAPERGSESGDASPSRGSSTQSAPPYVPPSVPSLPAADGAPPSSGDVQWRPMRRQ